MNPSITNRALPNVTSVESGVRDFSNSNDPLGILDGQGQSIVIDTGTDPLNMLSEPAPNFPRSQQAIDADRLRAKTINVFSLNSNHDEQATELVRASKLVRL